jgi:PIN domain nuclease of toxin-antitoxin system
MSTVNLAEVVGYFARRGLTEKQITEILAPLPIELVPFDEAQAVAAGMLLPATRAAGLSLGDRACLALAKRLGSPLQTADRIWETLSPELGIAIFAIR